MTFKAALPIQAGLFVYTLRLYYFCLLFTVS